ncbi:MAG: uroporphyrinogen-III synthase [Ferruginibacter sp.]
MDEQLIQEANDKGIDIDILSFIETEPIESVEVQQEIEAVLNAAATVVFTSMNAVEAVEEHVIDEQPEWIIYCIGNTTKELVKKYFPLSKIAGTADSSAELAALIIEESSAEEVVFFCGDLRRDELPTMLKQQDIEVNEIVVYQTMLVPHKVQKEYLGILFFSPSAVESFFIKNKLSPTTILFAIGVTTAATIRKHTGNKILIADQPGKENLVEKMIEYFT